MKRYQMLIGGEWIDAEARETFETENPYLGAAWAFVPRAKGADVDRAVDAAFKAFRAPSWAKISATRARRASAQARRSDRRRSRSAGGDRDTRQRQADHRDADAAPLHTAVVQLFRRPRGQDRRAGHSDRQARHDQLHPRRAARGRGGDHAVEFAVDARRPGSSRRLWPPAIRSSGSPRNSPRCRRSNSEACSRRPAFRPAS